MPSADQYSGSSPAPEPKGPRGASAASLEELGAWIARADETMANYGPRVEMLYRACQAAKIAVPGVPEMALMHVLTPEGEKVVGYMEGVLPTQAVLAKAVQVAIYRFNETRELIRVARRHHALGLVDTGVLGQLRQQMYFLGRYFEEFKQDPVLACIFPAPKVVEVGKTTPKVANPENVKGSIRHQLIDRAHRWVGWLEPKMKLAEKVLAVAENPATMSLKEMMSPEGRQVRWVTLALVHKPEDRAILKLGATTFRELERILEAAKLGGPVDELPKLIGRVDEVLFTCRKHAVLRDLFPAAGEPNISKETLLKDAKPVP